MISVYFLLCITHSAILCCKKASFLCSGYITQQEMVDIGTRLVGPKLEPKGPRAEVGSQLSTRGFQAFNALCLAFMAFK